MVSHRNYARKRGGGANQDDIRLRKCLPAEPVGSPTINLSKIMPIPRIVITKPRPKVWSAIHVQPRRTPPHDARNLARHIFRRQHEPMRLKPTPLTDRRRRPASHRPSRDTPLVNTMDRNVESGLAGPGALNHPSNAIELPNGNILVCDDWNDRVIVIDRNSKHILWQYGRQGVAGTGAGYPNIPDEVSFIPPE